MPARKVPTRGSLPDGWLLHHGQQSEVYGPVMRGLNALVLIDLNPVFKHVGGKDFKMSGSATDAAAVRNWLMRARWVPLILSWKHVLFGSY